MEKEELGRPFFLAVGFQGVEEGVAVLFLHEAPFPTQFVQYIQPVLL